MYTKHNWVNGDAPYINATNLNEIENGIIGAYNNLIGFICYYCKVDPPNGWLVCDGSAISRTKYGELFNVLGSTFGGGDGSTTFNLPDLRGEFIRGYSAGSSIDSGRIFGSKQDGTAFETGSAIIFESNFEVEQTGVQGYPHGGYSSMGSHDVVSVRPRNIALLPCIFTGVNTIDEEV